MQRCVEQNKNLLEFVAGGKYSDRQEARNWILQYDKMLEDMIHQEALANWNYATNITDYTAQRVSTFKCNTVIALHLRN